MKRIRITLCAIISLLAINVCAQEAKQTIQQERLLWIVDGVALRDSTFHYTLGQMQSDSATILAQYALNWLHHLPDIKVSSIATDSIPGYDGIVQVETNCLTDFLLVINGYPYPSPGKATVGEMLGGEDYIKPIIYDKYPDIESFVIENLCVLKYPFSNSALCCHPSNPVVLMTTQKPYYGVGALAKTYVGKQRQWQYELSLNNDGTYIIHLNKTANADIYSTGTWTVANNQINLTPNQQPAPTQQPTPPHSGKFVESSPTTLQIISHKKIKAPANAWNNPKPFHLHPKSN